MSVQVHPTDWMRQLLCNAGFNQPPAGCRRLSLGLDVLVRDDDTAAAIAGPPRLTPTQLGGAPLQAQFEAHLQRTLRRLQTLAARGMQVQHLFFVGNGPLTLPRWFRDACTELNISIHTVDPALPPESLAPFF